MQQRAVRQSATVLQRNYQLQRLHHHRGSLPYVNFFYLTTHWHGAASAAFAMA